ncbi:MAG: hypothetical protein LBO72_11055 [Helicobacteraceae bacterium]|jgi:hypothetical protein|nr:hypothetical protein [Helicobacteraceae bacterium]
MAIYTPDLVALRYLGESPYKLRVLRSQVTLEKGDIALVSEVAATMLLRSRNSFVKADGAVTFLSADAPKKPKAKKGKSGLIDGDELAPPIDETPIGYAPAPLTPIDDEGAALTPIDEAGDSGALSV